MRSRFSLLSVLLMIAGCGNSDVKYMTAGSADMAMEMSEVVAVQDPELDMTVAGKPKIAYTYGFDYELPLDSIDDVQNAHLKLCEDSGPARCRVVQMQSRSGDGRYSTASLNLLVAANVAKTFGERLDALATQGGGDESARSILAEDLSKKISDTNARIAAKEALTTRLLQLLKSRQGSVGDLVEAERAFAEAQEELDAARSWLAEMQQLVDMSVVKIAYRSNAIGDDGLIRPIREAVTESGAVFGRSVGALISFTAIILPWLALLALFIWIKRRLGWSIRRSVSAVFRRGPRG